MDAPALYPHLYRSRDSLIGGVCAGIARYFDMDALVVRILAVILLIVTFGLAFFVYMVLWVYIPRAPEVTTPYEVSFEDVASVVNGPVEFLPDPDGSSEDEWIAMPVRGLPMGVRLAMVAGLLLLYFVLSFLLASSVEGIQWWQLWPILLLIIGIFFIVIPIRSERQMAWHAGGVIVAIAGVALMPMSVAVNSWDSLPYSLELLWPILLLACGLFVVGVVRNIKAFILSGTVCFVIFCLAGSVLCALPGSMGNALQVVLFNGMTFELPLSWISILT